MSTFARAVATAAAFLVYGVLSVLYAPQATLIAGNVAGRQFENSDTGYLTATYWTQFLSGIGGGLSLALLVVLLFIWLKPIVAGLSKAPMPALLLVALAGAASELPTAAYAYYDKNDYTEAYTILPNESAFWIPDVGANKDNQAQLESEAYLNANKVALKRFVVPHVKLQGSGAFFDFYVPSGRLIIVDRTPFSREWVDAQDRGTSAHKEGFPCQSKEGLNITVGVAIGASVSEQNAAKYLYRFGVVPPKGNRNEPQVIFTSVYLSRSVKEVMDDFGRKKVAEIICDQITARTFDKANEEAKLIKDTAAKSVTEYFATLGITIDFVGWADTFTFDKEVQDAVNRRYIANKDQEIAAALQPYANVIQALAAAQALRAFGEKTDGKLPTTIVGLPPELGAILGTMLKSGPATPAAATR